MPDFSEINPHLALWQSENAVDAGEAAWLRWIANAERLIGHTLDGSATEVGYSLDEAHDAFCAGISAGDHVAEVRERAAYVAPECAVTGQHVTSLPSGLSTYKGLCLHCGMKPKVAP